MSHALDNIYHLDEIKRDEQQHEESMLDAAIDCREVEGKGRGIFARRFIAKGEVVERAPVVPMSKDDIPESGGVPDGYVLEWREDTPGEEHAIVLGYIMLYNHSEDPNLYLESDFDNGIITATATRDIQAGEELGWNYNCEIWFDLS